MNKRATALTGDRIDVRASLDLVACLKVSIQQGQCYRNCRQVIQHYKEYRDAIYVEGFWHSDTGSYIPHAWIEREGWVIDPTSALVGIYMSMLYKERHAVSPPDEEYAIKRMRLSRYWSGIRIDGRKGLTEQRKLLGRKYYEEPFWHSYDGAWRKVQNRVFQEVWGMTQAAAIGTIMPMPDSVNMNDTCDLG